MDRRAFILCFLLILPAGLAGLASAGYWGWSEHIGRGDLRAYGLMQLVPILFVPLLLWLYPPRYCGERDILVVLGLVRRRPLADDGVCRRAAAVESPSAAA